MTLEELSQLYYLNREIEMNRERLTKLDVEIKEDEERLAELERSASSPSSPNYDGMPKSTGYGNKIESAVIKIQGVEERIKHKKALRGDIAKTIRDKQNLCLVERDKLERYIAELPTSLLRMIFTYRFVEGLTWGQVSASIGVRTTEDGVKKMCYRHLNGQNAGK